MLSATGSTGLQKGPHMGFAIKAFRRSLIYKKKEENDDKQEGMKEGRRDEKQDEIER